MVSKTMHKYTPRILIAKVIFKILFVSDDFTIPSIILDVISNSLLYFSIKYLLFSLNHFSIYLDSKYNAKGIPNSADDWEKIRDCLKAYTEEYSDSSYKDTNTNGTTYSEDYKNMLKSVYTNGGFWIGRYEAGLEGDTPRTSYTKISPSDKAVVKQNKIPYNYVTRDEAQELATRMNYNECTSSLIFGVQWDLVMKYLETKGTSQADLKTNSTNWGNYSNNAWNITNENLKYAEYKNYPSLQPWTTATEKSKTASEDILLSTGASESFSKMGIYDLAGNEREWTLEYTSYTSAPCVYRGGACIFLGSFSPASNRDYSATTTSIDYIGFRLALY